MSNSDFACRSCGRTLGEVKHGGLRHDPAVPVRNFLTDGYAVLTCPGCGETRVWRGGVVEAKRAEVAVG